MNTRRTRQILWLAALLLAVMSAGVALWAFQPVTVALPSSPDGAAGNNTGRGTAQRPLPSLAELNSLAQVNLRRPIFDATVAAAPPPPPPPPLTIKLAGTIIEPGNNQAMIVTREGDYQRLRVGEKSGEAEVQIIERESITVRYYGKSIVLKVDRPEGG